MSATEPARSAVAWRLAACGKPARRAPAYPLVAVARPDLERPEQRIGRGQGMTGGRPRCNLRGTENRTGRRTTALPGVVVTSTPRRRLLVLTRRLSWLAALILGDPQSGQASTATGLGLGRSS